LQWDVADTRVQFPAGVAVLNIDWGDVGPISYNPEASVIVGDTGFSVLPGGDRYWDYTTGEWVEETNVAPFIAFGGWIITEVNKPIFLPGHLTHYVKVMPGDFIFADNDGAQLIPKTLVDEVLLRVEATFEKENAEREQIASGMPIDEVYRKFGVL
jgi:hypothetical protein